MTEQAENNSQSDNPAKRKAKSQVGQVVSNKMDKTITVAVTKKIKDKDYGKYVKRTNKFKAHDAENTCRIGDQVKITETRPLSKTKRWELKEVITKAVE